MRDDPIVIALVARARDGDQPAWDKLVERYAPLVWSICCRYRLSDADAHDAGQNVWLRLVEYLPSLRDPAALPGWLTTTTRRECLRVRRAGWQRERPSFSPSDDIPADEETTQVDRMLIEAERNSALREGFRLLEPQCQRLLSMLMHDPPVSYARISANLSIPIGSIGPTRARCLDKLRRIPSIAALLSESPEVEGRRSLRDERVVDG